MGCGMGRHTVLLARNGFNVTAFDGSPDALRHTEEWLRRSDATAQTSISDFRTFQYGLDKYDAIISINVLHHALEEDVRTTIQNICEGMREKGFILATVPRLSDSNKYGKQIERCTFVPEGGSEKGIPHLLFTKELVYELFSGFQLEPLTTDHIDHLVIKGQKISMDTNS